MLANGPATPGEQPDTTRRLTPGPLVLEGGGGLVLQPVVDGQLLDDLVGPRWLVVARDAALLTGTNADAWRALDAVLLSVDELPALKPILDRAAADGTVADVVVVRPDRHILTVGPTLVAPPLIAVPKTAHPARRAVQALHD